MKKPVVIFFTAVIFLSVINFLAGCEKETGHRPGNENGTVENTDMIDSTIIREAGTDVASLDENKDGKLYQCPMDFEVISDSEARCPICKMDLEEYSVNETTENFK